MSREYKYDVAVVGGGPSGIAAAAGAAKSGAKTVLIERNPYLGGEATNSGVAAFCGFYTCGGDPVKVVAGVGDQVLQELQKLGNTMNYIVSAAGNKNVNFKPEYLKCALDNLMDAEGVDCLMHAALIGAKTEGNRILSLQCVDDEGAFTVTAGCFVDCTGDANAVKIAGLEYLQPETTQPGTLSIYFHNFDYDKLDFEQMEKNFANAVAAGELFPEDMGWARKFNRGFFLGFGGNSNHIVGINAADSAGKTRMEIEGRRSIRRIYNFLRKQPGLEQVEFHIKSGECGVRETRMIVGEKTITVEDYLAGRRYDDSVCYAFYPVDLHDAKHGLVNESLKPGVVPTVPLGALIPKNSKGFLAAGRILSSDRLANSALRIQATCMATGQAAGAAAALAVRDHLEPRDVPFPELRTLLEANGAIVP